MNGHFLMAGEYATLDDQAFSSTHTRLFAVHRNSSKFLAKTHDS